MSYKSLLTTTSHVIVLVPFLFLHSNRQIGFIIKILKKYRNTICTYAIVFLLHWNIIAKLLFHGYLIGTWNLLYLYMACWLSCSPLLCFTSLFSCGTLVAYSISHPKNSAGVVSCLSMAWIVHSKSAPSPTQKLSFDFRTGSVPDLIGLHFSMPFFNKDTSPGLSFWCSFCHSL